MICLVPIIFSAVRITVITCPATAREGALKILGKNWLFGNSREIDLRD